MFVKKLAQLRPRYIMNLAIKGPDAWFVYFYRRTRGEQLRLRLEMVAKENPWMGELAEQLDMLREDNTDQISYCSFGENDKVFFVRSTDYQRGWHARPSQHIPRDLHHAFMGEFNRGTPRAITFGKAKTWILYGKKNVQLE